MAAAASAAPPPPPSLSRTEHRLAETLTKAKQSVLIHGHDYPALQKWALCHGVEVVDVQDHYPAPQPNRMRCPSNAKPKLKYDASGNVVGVGKKKKKNKKNDDDDCGSDDGDDDSHIIMYEVCVRAKTSAHPEIRRKLGGGKLVVCHCDRADSCYAKVLVDVANQK